MNWRKVIGYILLILLLFTLVAMYKFNRLGKQIYGGLTEKVDHRQFKPQEGAFAITNVHLLSPNGKQMLAGQTILLEKGKISAIGQDLKLPLETNVIDGTGKYLIPGLIDAHVHFFQSSNDLLLYIANGVTEVRELIGAPHHLKWRKQIEEGRIGPKMFVASPRLGTFNTKEGWMMEYTQGYKNVPNAKAAKKIIKKFHKQGYDGIKIYSQLSPESYQAIAETANSLGMPFFGHIPWQVELNEIYTSGQSGVAHFEELMNALQRDFDEQYEQYFGSFYGKEEAFLAYVDARSDELADQLIENDITITSTLWLTESFVRQKFELEQVLKEVELAYQNPGISEWVSFIPEGLGWLPEVNRYKLRANLNEQELIEQKKYWYTYGKACRVLARNLAKRGVRIMAGTDANLPPTVPGFSLHDELLTLQNAGLSPAQVLQTATINPAQWMKHESGKIVPGYTANLVLLDKNPLEDIGHTRTIHTVISEGRVFDRALLDSILAAVKAANEASRKVDISVYQK